VSEVPLGKVELALDEVTTEIDDRWHPIKPDGRASDVSGDVSPLFVFVWQLARVLVKLAKIKLN